MIIYVIGNLVDKVVCTCSTLRNKFSYVEFKLYTPGKFTKEGNVNDVVSLGIADVDPSTGQNITFIQWSATVTSV